MINYSSTRAVLKRSGNGGLSLRIYEASGRELCSLLFDEKKSDESVTGVKIVDLLTRQRFVGVGTYVVNLFIGFCKKNYPENITVYGDVFHQEYLGSYSTMSEEERANHRARRNKFWQGFGFNLILEEPISDKIRAKLSELNYKNNQNFTTSIAPEIVIVEAFDA